MVINREMALVVVKHFDDTTNAYGEIKKGAAASQREVMMALKIYRQTNVQEAQFVDVTNIGLTYDTSITPGDLIEKDGNAYNVLFVIPSQRLTTLMLKKVG